MEKEGVLLEKKANHWRGTVADGGKLILTEKYLIFKPHRFNIASKTVTIDLNDIKDVGKTETKLGMSKEIWVSVKNGPTERFVVWGRDEMIDAINKWICIRKE